jgi:P27 family predicted phage terminase small subunit
MPKPSAIEIAEGCPGKRAINRYEPQPRAEPPDCPEYLDERAVEEWQHLIPILMRMRVLTEADGLMLGCLCMAVSTLARAQAKLSETGILYKAKSGYVSPSPLLAIVNQSVETITKLSREFGLSPASRVRLMVDRQTESDADVIDVVSCPLEASYPPDVSYPLAITSGNEEDRQS